MQRIGDYVETFSGRTFYPLDPRPEEIYIVDIAHHLSQICRYNGASKFFFSVGQHSINCYKYVKSQNATLMEQFDAFMHDTPEAYLCDLPKPIKECMSEYKIYEEIVRKAIYKKYGLLEDHFETTKKVDVMMLSHEASILMPCKTWNHNPIILPEIVIEERIMSSVEDEFLTIFQKLRSQIG